MASLINSKYQHQSGMQKRTTARYLKSCRGARIYSDLGPAGIVYVFSQKDAESVSSALQKRGILASPYHANMDPADKSHVHRRWSTNKIQVFSSSLGTVYVMGFFEWLRLSFDVHVNVVTPPITTG